MTVIRRGGAIALWLALALSGCKKPVATVGGPGTPNFDAAVFQECTSVCVRPGDCAKIYNDDGICPVGFLCALRFSGCSTD